MSDGSALILATGNLRTPKGFWYQGKGLKPTYELKNGDAETTDYLMKVRALSGGQKTGHRGGEREWSVAQRVDGVADQPGVW